jgi:hypothetical protein
MSAWSCLLVCRSRGFKVLVSAAFFCFLWTRTETYTILIKLIRRKNTIFTKLLRGVNHRIHNIYNAIQGRELTHTQYLKTNQQRELTLTTISTKLFIGENKHVYNIYKTI